jgi:hypothetical protein
MVTSFLAFPGVAKHFAGFGESPADGGFGAVSDGGDVSGAEAFEISKDEDGAVGFRKFLQDSLDLHSDLIATIGGGGCCVCEPFFGSGGKEGPATAALLTSEVIAGEINGESEQPWAEAAGWVELLQSLKGAEESFLGQVRNGFSIDDETLNDLHDASFVADHELSEGVVVALASKVDKARFAKGAVCGRRILGWGVQIE